MTFYNLYDQTLLAETLAGMDLASRKDTVKGIIAEQLDIGHHPGEVENAIKELIHKVNAILTKDKYNEKAAKEIFDKIKW